ncbi:MAG TPA: SLC13 family permease, partial [Gemmatimonadota bacterium]|nr:SLC13 family permease [Gemmatimonadota bacterium]
MGWDAWVTLAVLLVTIAALAREILPPSGTILGAVIALLAAGVITPAQAFAGFSNPAPITVAALYVLARAVDKTGAIQPIVTKTLGKGDSIWRSLARLAFPTAGASAFLNNTPIVAMLVPQVADWADRRGFSPSHFLLPLSYAAIFGGMVTLMGTSTNLVVSGLLENAGEPALGMFEITKLGLPIALVGILLLVLLAPLLLPERRPARGDLGVNVREFVVNLDVVDEGPLDGSSVEGGGLRHLQGVYLVEVDRSGELIAPVPPDTVLHGGDRLTFV